MIKPWTKFYVNIQSILLVLFFSLTTVTLFAQADDIKIEQNKDGMKLMVNGNAFMINGMNWDYYPIGTNFTYSLWKQPDDIIKSALDAEMLLLQNMGVNVIRQYSGVPAKWIQYIYEKYGIYTMLNHSFGRYGLTIEGAWIPNTEYSDAATRKFLLSEVKALAKEYKNTPGLLMYLLGNENNYGLFWDGAETEDIPIEDRKSTKRARSMYKLFNTAAVAMKDIDSSHPVAMCNGDLLFLDIIAEECKDVDILGTNMYRGVSFGDAFQRVKDEFNKPIMFTEFGADAFNAIDNQEDQMSQAYYMVGNWKEIYENAAGLGKTGNSLGGFTFQFSDGWWKYGQTEFLDVHDNNASWSNGGYPRDYEAGQDNMNEEWFGICAKGPTNQRGLYSLYPRAAYYTLKEAHLLNPYASGISLSSIEQHFANIQLMDAVTRARGDKAVLLGEELKKVRVSHVRADLTTYYTGGELISTPKEAIPNAQNYPNELGFDHMQSYYIGVEAKPSESVRASVTFNILGNVAENPINEIFYENRGRSRAIQTPDGDLQLGDINRVQVYQGEFQWNDKNFDINGFYRTGHYHWGYEGDLFGLYPEANYGPNIDIYNGNAPFGFEFAGKRKLDGLKIAAGPELWWGANPAVLFKYSKKLAGFNVTGIYHEDLDEQGNTVSSFAIPVPLTRRVTLAVERKFGPISFALGGIWGGQPLVGRSFQLMNTDPTDKTVYQDVINDEDTWGGKIKLSFFKGRFRWYGQAAAMGLVANGGADYTQTLTGWRLKDSGSGNQYNVLSGFTMLFGNVEIAPNFLWQKPLVGPIPFTVDAPGRPRNILDDPFAVRGNRETVAGELLITFDPTPGTWMYQWDNDRAEDAPFAMSASFVYRHLPTTQDAAIGIFADGRTIFAFPGAPPAEDLWDVNVRMVSKINPELGIIANLYAGKVQANGSDDRILQRYGGDLRLVYKKVKLASIVKVNDWGPFDYHRDFNLTFPLQLALDLSTSVGKAEWFALPNTRMGVRYTWRSLNQYSPRYCPTTALAPNGEIICVEDAPGFDNGQEWEVGTYFQFNIGR